MAGTRDSFFVIPALAGSALVIAGASSLSWRWGLIVAGLTVLFWVRLMATAERREREKAEMALAAERANSARRAAPPPAQGARQPGSNPASCPVHGNQPGVVMATPPAPGAS